MKETEKESKHGNEKLSAERRKSFRNICRAVRASCKHHLAKPLADRERKVLEKEIAVIVTKVGLSTGFHWKSFESPLLQLQNV